MDIEGVFALLIGGVILLAALSVVQQKPYVVTETNPPPPDNENTYRFGFAAYPRLANGTYSTTVIDQIISEMNAHHLEIYRMTFGTTQAVNTYVQYYLEHCDYDLIIDYYHQYPSGAFSSSDKTASISRALNIMGNFSAYQDRIWLEPYNERSGTEMATWSQTFVDTIRNAGYTCRIVCEKWYDLEWYDYAAVYDPLGLFYTGRHPYFSETTLASAIAYTQEALTAGCKVMNTEGGADIHEETYFSQAEVDAVESYLLWCYQHDVGMVVWQRYGLENWDTYEAMGLSFP